MWPGAGRLGPGLLLAGVGMEIIPLFYISPAFAAGLKRVLPFAVIILLFWWSDCRGSPVVGAGALAVARLRAFVVHLMYNANAL